MNLFIFHRDLRLVDNTALIAQIKKMGSKIVPAFIFTPEQVDRNKNKYFSSNSVQFMIESLKDLNKQVEKYNGKMYYFYGDNLDVLNNIYSKFKINSIGFNLDYTPYAKSRDDQIKNWAKQRNIQVVAKQDYGLYNLFQMNFMGKNNTPPTFTPFKLHCYQNYQVRRPDDFSKFEFQVNQELRNLEGFYDFQQKSKQLYDYNQNLAVRGGREQALKIINNFKAFKNYFYDRNYPALPATKLSAYLHFTNVSMRQVYHNVVKTLGIENHIIFQLHCRQFFTYICHKFPNTLKDEKFKNLRQQFNQIKWSKNQQYLQRWKQGKTGVPFIDAGMRQMNATGYMHNRTRQNVACFLVKDLFIDWQEGQKYFAEKLVDYSATQNSGNWQYVAGVGTDPMQTRVFNPYLQAQKYDPDCEYIKRWIPELKQVPSQDILKWDRVYQFYIKKGVNYPKPIVDHELETKQTVKVYKNVLKNFKFDNDYKQDKQGQKIKSYYKNKHQDKRPKKVVYKEKVEGKVL